MIKIGIDYSMVSPAICVYKDGEYSFISFFDDYGKDWMSGKNKTFMWHRNLQGTVEMIPYTRNIDKKDYRTEQKTKMTAAKMIAEKISGRLVEIVGEDDVTIGIEGFSYGSISSSTLDLTLFNSFLRIKLLEDFGEDCIVVIPPTEAKKKLSGKGNAKKEDMIEAFIKNMPEDHDLESCPFWKFCRDSEFDYKNIKPIDDLVDSYGILICI